MAILFVIIGGVIGGFLGWLFDRRAGRKKVEAGIQPVEACETNT